MCIHIYMSKWRKAGRQEGIYLAIDLSIYIYIHVCVCVCVAHIYVYIYIYTYIYMYTFEMPHHRLFIVLVISGLVLSYLDDDWFRKIPPNRKAWRKEAISRDHQSQHLQTRSTHVTYTECCTTRHNRWPRFDTVTRSRNPVDANPW